jgi:dTDP-4-dehydrorhamnose reductase
MNVLMKNYFSKILIAGSDGQIGNALRAHAAGNEFKLIACGRQEMNITDINNIRDALKKFSPDIVINAAAYTAVDKAEKDGEREQALLVNHLGTRNLAIACREHSLPLIHLSTDYIFDGRKKSPYQENDLAQAINYYGESKWLGEEALRQEWEEHIILRISAVFSEYGNNFLKTILRLASERKELNVVADQITCPSYAGNIAGVIFAVVKQVLGSQAQASHPDFRGNDKIVAYGNNKSPHTKWGTYHYCDKHPVSWHGFAEAIVLTLQHSLDPAVKLEDESLSSVARNDNIAAQANNTATKINAITTAEYPTPARRPLYSVLDCSKLENDYGIQQMAWMPSLNAIIKKLIGKL